MDGKRQGEAIKRFHHFARCRAPIRELVTCNDRECLDEKIKGNKAKFIIWGRPGQFPKWPRTGAAFQKRSPLSSSCNEQIFELGHDITFLPPFRKDT